MDMSRIAPGHQPGNVFTGNICFCKKCNALLSYSALSDYSKIIYTDIACGLMIAKDI